MTRVVIDLDEWWPVPVVARKWFPCQDHLAVEVPDEVLERFEKAEGEFEAAGKELEGYARWK